MKTLLLLGAGQDQLFAIKTAKAMGLTVLAVDINPNAPGFELVDHHEIISTRNVSKIIKFVDNYISNGNNIDGVLVMGSDIPHVVSQIADHIGTFSIPINSANLATNKFKMKEQFKKSNIKIPWYSLISEFDELKKIIQKRNFPLVIKPLDNSGSRGVFLLKSDTDLLCIFKECLSFSSIKKILVEEFLPGLQISTETIMYQNKGYTVGFADRNYEMLEMFSPRIIENGGTIPSKLDDSTKKEIEDLVEKAALSLGISNGVVKGDVVLTPDGGPHMIEMAARLSGGDFSESLIPLGTGVNIVKAAIKISLSEELDPESLNLKHSQYVANRYFFVKPGILKQIDGIDVVSNKPWIKKLDFWYSIGDEITEIKSHADRFGVFVVIGDSLEDLNDKISWVYSTIKINIETQ